MLVKEVKKFFLKRKYIPRFIAKRVEQKQHAALINRVRLSSNRHLYEELKADIYSFDVFDTTIHRKTGTPEGIFVKLQEALDSEPGIPVELRRSFASERVLAEKAAKKKVLPKIVNIKEIYDALAEKFQLSSTVKDYLLNRELKFEYEWRLKYGMFELRDEYFDYRGTIGSDGIICIVEVDLCGDWNEELGWDMLDWETRDWDSY